MEFAKPKIKSFYKWKTFLVHRKFDDTNELYYTNLKRLFEQLLTDHTKRPEIQKLKARMLHLQLEFTKQSITYIKFHIQGEKISTFQIQIQIKNREKSRIKTLTIDEAETIEQNEITSRTIS
jgi:hypothetical protein